MQLQRKNELKMKKKNKEQKLRVKYNRYRKQMDRINLMLEQITRLKHDISIDLNKIQNKIANL